MSINIHFIATRKVKVIKTKRVVTQEIKFNEWQTPSEVTGKIMASADPIQAYKDWILTDCSIDVETDVFAEDDIFQEREPIGKEVFNAGKEHIEKFDEWLKICAEEGFEVRAEPW